LSYLIDTNIISEVRKGERCDARVAAWYASIADEDLFLSTLVLGEIRKGIELARPRDPDKAAALEGWLAVTAPTNGLTLVTRNDRDIAGLGAAVLNPFRPGDDHRRS
jgi:predicted nucleic acid-binding protein